MTLEEGALQGGEKLETASQVRPLKVNFARRYCRIGRTSASTAQLYVLKKTKENKVAVVNLTRKIRLLKRAVSDCIRFKGRVRRWRSSSLIRGQVWRHGQPLQFGKIWLTYYLPAGSVIQVLGFGPRLALGITGQ